MISPAHSEVILSFFFLCIRALVYQRFKAGYYEKVRRGYRKPGNYPPIHLSMQFAKSQVLFLSVCFWFCNNVFFLAEKVLFMQ